MTTGAGPCPECGAEWAYEWTTDGWDGSLPCTRLRIVADDGPPYALCPDCGARFESDPSLVIPPAMTQEELLAARERRQVRTTP